MPSMITRLTTSKAMMLKNKMVQKSIAVHKGSPTVYQLPTSSIVIHKEDRIQKYEVEGYQAIHRTEKIIMMVGATGAGKSTLINSMVNHIYGVEWSDEYRFKLVLEPTSNNQAHSQTSWITAYTLKYEKDFTVPYTLTIIDTPGFGDTQGIQRDKEITRQIRTFFHTAELTGIDHIDVIGFVVQASLPRLTASQKYIFDSVLSSFGKDIAENIYMMVTFADAKKSPVLSAIKEANIPYVKYFKFNSSAFFPDVDVDEDEYDQDVEDFDKMYWKTGNMSLKHFFQELNKTSSKSLVLTKEVLHERYKLDIYIMNLQNEIKQGISKLDNLKQTYQIIQSNDAVIACTRNYEATTTHNEQKHVPLGSGIHTTTCLQCNHTCHVYCHQADNGKKRLCRVMDPYGYCTVCPGHCIWSAHMNVPYKVVSVPVTKREIVDDLFAKYQIANREKVAQTQIMEKMKIEFRSIQLIVHKTIDEVRKSLAIIKEIALKPNPLSTVDYINLLILAEEDEALDGWKHRVDHLKEARKEAKYAKDVLAQDFDPFLKHTPAFL